MHPGQAGQRNKSELGLDWYVSRFYDPALGRFIQPDSIIPDPGSAKGYDRYAYVNNNPINFNDPSGHMDSSDDDKEAGCNTPGSPKCIIDKYYGASTDYAYLESLELYYYRAAYPEYNSASDVNLSGTDRAIVEAPQTRADCVNGSGGACAFLVGISGMSSPGLIDAQMQGGGPSQKEKSRLQLDAEGDPDCIGCGYVMPGSGSATSDLLMPGGEPIGTSRNNPNIRTVSQQQMDNIINNLMVNAQRINDLRYPGQRYQLPDGSMFGIRTSQGWGLTVDLQISGIPIDKLHLP